MSRVAWNVGSTIVQESMYHLEKLVQETGKSELDVMAEAMRSGFRHMQQDWVVDRTLCHEIARDAATDFDRLSIARESTGMLPKWSNRRSIYVGLC